MQLNITEEQKLRNRRIAKLLSDVAFYVVLIALITYISCFALTYKTGAPNAFGYRHFYIASESMEPVIRTGQFVMTKTIEPDNVQIDDIVAYRDNERDIVIIHRVIDIREDDLGNKLFTFKGDNNNFVDPYDVTEDMILYKVILY